MKKVEKVSIAEIAFTLDQDAYLSLRRYLDHLHDYYDKAPDGPEIVTDIEGRIAELILGEQVYTKVVSRRLVDRIIVQLGTPEEIEADGETDPDGFDGPHAGRGGFAPSPSEASIPRRLHRSAEGKIVGGVCSGIARFWDTNPASVRLVLMSPLIIGLITLPWGPGRHTQNFFFGWSWVFFVLYIVLWVVLPMARTPRQKLESRGEKVTPASIRQNLQEGASTPAGRKAASVTAELVNVLGRVVLFFVKFAMAIAGFAMMLATMAMFIAMVAVLVNPDSAVIVDSNPVNFLSVFEGMAVVSPAVFAALAVLVGMLPVMIVGVAMLGFTFSWRLGRAFYAITLGVWALVMIFLGIVCVSNIGFFHDEVPDRIDRWEGSNGVLHWRDGEFKIFDAESGEWVRADEDNGNRIIQRRNGKRAEIRVSAHDDNAASGATSSADSLSVPATDSLSGGAWTP